MSSFATAAATLWLAAPAWAQLPPQPEPAPVPPPAPAPAPAAAPATAPPQPTVPPAVPPPTRQPAPPGPPGAYPPPAMPPPPVSYLPPGASAPPPGADVVPPDRDEVHWFARVGVGVGPRGVASNNALLDEVGYASVKMWAELEAAYMFHRHIGAGVWMGMNRRSGQPAEGQGSKLNAVAYFIGVEAPILLWGERDYAFQLVPRGGFLSGQLELDNDVDAPFQKTGIFGAALTFNSFTYHLGGSVAYTYAPAGSVSELGRTHDYGGFYVMLVGSIDG